MKAVQAFIDKGYAKKLSTKESRISTPRTWYLPHFGVTNPNKPGKIRVVFDAAARARGVSLNDMLLKGPDQYRPLLGILFRFREGKVAVCGDIAEMFPQVLIRSEDRPSQRFLWRYGDQKNPINVFEMVSMTFGAKCSPSSAQFVKNVNAMRYSHSLPAVVQEVIENHYVDDFVSSSADENVALETSLQVKMIHAEAGFNLRGFVSNSRLVAETLNGSASVEINMNVGNKDSTEKILGLFWMTSCDSFTFKCKYNKISQDVMMKKRFPTKRELLGLVMSVYDPLGFLANHLIAAKLLLQEVWKQKLDWDDFVPESIARKWYAVQECISQMESFRIPRCHFNDDKIQAIELHSFVDASDSAIAAVCYFRIVYTFKEPEISFVIGKTKCYPTKSVSIPRCELLAAVLGSKLKASIVEYHRLKIDKFFYWSDSRTVLYWIKNNNTKYKQYVSNRVTTILGSSHACEWNWVPTKLNPADDGTRTKLQIVENDRWIFGPLWLKDYDNWPIQPDIFQTTTSQEEMTRISIENVLIINPQAQAIDITKYSSYLKLWRVTTWILRYKINLQNRIRNLPLINGPLNVGELRKAEILLCRTAQIEVYHDEYSRLLAGKSISKRSRIMKLLPYLDENKLLRVFGRIDNSELLPITTKRPIILPDKHSLTNLIVDFYHNICIHQNAEEIICEIRRKFWVNGLRSLVKKSGRRCIKCRNENPQCYQPIMGQLPKDRLSTFVRPFTYTGLDYFGPVTVTI